jgi:hypothetical protein
MPDAACGPLSVEKDPGGPPQEIALAAISKLSAYDEDA